MTNEEWRNVYRELESLQIIFNEFYNNEQLTFLVNEKYLLKLIDDTVRIINNNQDVKELLLLNGSNPYIEFMETKGYYIIPAYNIWTSNLLMHIKHLIT